ncbi:MAG TPA: hypothetical protein VFZ48_00515 [Candidatus Saccharimonadales bacterium]
MKSFLDYIGQVIMYGVFKNKPDIDFSEIPETISFVSHYDKDNDVHWLESPELPEFYVTGKNVEELARNTTDTLLVYYDVPTYFARRFSHTAEFKFTNQKTGKEETIHIKEELHRAIA